jgi:hypothetical protein
MQFNTIAKHLAFSSNTSRVFQSFGTNHFGMALVDGLGNKNPESKGMFSIFYDNLTQNNLNFFSYSIGGYLFYHIKFGISF